MPLRTSMRTIAAVLTGTGLIVAAPWVLSTYWVGILVVAGTLSIAAVGLNIQTGAAGQVSLGQATLFAAGAYGSVWASRTLAADMVVWLVVGTMAALFVGLLLGPIVSRLDGHHLIVVTIAVVFIGLHVLRNWTSLSGGLGGTPVEAHLVVFGSDLASWPWLGRDAAYLYVVWLIVGGSTWFGHNVLRSGVGRGLRAVRESEPMAMAMGASPARAKRTALLLAAAFGGLGGALYASYRQFLLPDEWNLVLSIQFVAVIIVGGDVVTES